MADTLEKIREQRDKLKAKMNDDLKKLKARENAIIARQNQQERKARTRRLIQFGGLGDIAGLTEKDPATILGGLLMIAKNIEENNALLATWQIAGSKMLDDRKMGKPNE